VRRVLLPLAALAVALAGCGSSSSKGTSDATVVLDFTPNAAHAGIYEASGLGLDRRAYHVHLVVHQPSATTDSLKLLASHKADLAVADIHDLGLARERGEDLVGVGALVQRPLAAVIAAPSVKRPRDLEGKTVGVTGVPSDNAVLRSIVQGDGGDPSKVKTVTIGFSAVGSLLAHRVDGATAFWNVEGVTLERRGFHPREFRVDDFGAPRYPELVLVARRDEVEHERGLLHDALGAIALGEATAVGDADGTVRRISQASNGDPGLVRAEYNAILPAFLPYVQLQPKALAGWASFDTRFGILKRPPNLRQAFALGLVPQR